MREDNTVIIKGRVTNVVDGDTIDIEVLYIDPQNLHTYRPTERIRIYGPNAAELPSTEGLREKERTERKLLGKEITLLTRLRDGHGRIVAKIK